MLGLNLQSSNESGCIDLSQQAELNAEARTKSAHTSTEKSATQSQRQLAIDKANVWCSFKLPFALLSYHLQLFCTFSALSHAIW